MCDHEGFSLETHTVTSEDGYITTLLRVIKLPVVTENKSSPAENESTSLIKETQESETTNKIKPPVLIVHGVNCSGYEWMYHKDPNKALPFILVAEGYDCWIVSLRGSKLSRSHTTLKSKSRKYWDFSSHEIGCYDVPAMIDYILKTNKSEKIYYIGHSQGCTVFFIAMTMRPEYQSKVKAVCALAPCVYGNFVQVPLIKFAGWLFGLIDNAKIFYRQKTPVKSVSRYANVLCPSFLKMNPDKLIVWMMKTGGRYTGIYARNSEQIDKAGFVKAGQTIPSASSIKILAHIFQCYSSGKFQAYDHGRSGNLKKYGESTPPTYDLSKITVPTLIFSSKWDKLVPSEDVAQVAKELPNVFYYKEISDTVFSHADFQMGKDSDKLVYQPIIENFSKISQESDLNSSTNESTNL